MKWIVFDVDDTLYDMMTPFGYAFERLFGEAHRDVDLTRLFVLSRKYSDAVFEDTTSGRMTMEEMYIYRIRQSCADMGIAISEAEALQFQCFYEEGQAQLAMPAIIEELLTALGERKVAMGVITNGPSAHQWKKIRALGVPRWIPEERIVVSGDCDCAKPERAIYELAAEKFGAAPKDCLYVGDSLENDVVGPHRAGMHTLWINKRNVKNDTGVEPDYTVCNNEELRELLLELTR